MKHSHTVADTPALLTKTLPLNSIMDTSKASTPLLNSLVTTTSQVPKKPDILVDFDPMASLFVRRSLEQQTITSHGDVYAFRQGFLRMPHPNEINSFHEPERQLSHLVKSLYNLNIKVIRDLYYFAGQHGMMVLRLRNVTVFQVEGGTDMQRMYQLCNLAAEDIMTTSLEEGLSARFNWKAMTLAPRYTDAMVLIRFPVIKSPEGYYVEPRELSSGDAFSGRGQRLIDAKSQAVFSYVSAV